MDEVMLNEVMLSLKECAKEVSSFPHVCIQLSSKKTKDPDIAQLLLTPGQLRFVPRMCLVV